MEKLINIGKFVAVFGLQGELILQHALGKKSSLKGLKVLFIEEKKDSFLPYFIEYTKIKNETEIYIKLEGLDVKEKAKPLSNKPVWIKEEEFHRLAKKESPVSLLGFNIIHEKENLGEILEIIEQPHQILCRIDLNGNEALIPLNEAFLKKIDQKKKEVHVELPDGLLDLYR